MKVKELEDGIDLSGKTINSMIKYYKENDIEDRSGHFETETNKFIDEISTLHKETKEAVKHGKFMDFPGIKQSIDE
jgi:predicted ribonuclease toxin of YeeF-YezG toxin-antitoxin module